MISSNDLRPGITIELDGSVWQCVEFLHVKPGKGAAFVRAKLKNMVNGSVVERKFNAGIKLQPAIVERKPMQYLYEADESYCLWIRKRMNRLCFARINWEIRLISLRKRWNVLLCFSMGILSGLIFRTLLS